MIDATNRNTALASALVEELARSGVRRLVEALRSIARNEEVGERMHQTAFADRSFAMRSVE